MSTDRAGTMPARAFGAARDRPRLLTWGLLRPGDGTEYAIRAIALLGDRRRDVRYLIAGPTHPAALTTGRDDHRDWLTRTAWDAGVASSVRVDAVDRTPEMLAQLVASASAVIVSDDPSGAGASPVLAATLVAGRPVIVATSSDAGGLLAGDAGIVVPHGDPVALAAAIGSILDDPATLAAMAAKAAEIGPSIAWNAVDGRYRSVGDLVVDALDAT